MKKILFCILALALALVLVIFAVVFVHDNRIMKQKAPVHVTTRINAIYNPAPSSYSSGSGDRVVSGLNISIVD